MARYMITHSLLASWLHSMQDNPYEDMTTERDSFKEFLSVLKREPTPTTEAMQKGIDFENLVSNILSGNADEGEKNYAAAAEVADILEGAPLQVRCSKNVTINGMDILLYGRLDSLKGGAIYDIKFSGSYERGKYIDSTQHPMYFELVPEADKFIYIVSNGTYVWTEEYLREDTKLIEPIIKDFINYLNKVDLIEIFKRKWAAK